MCVGLDKRKHKLAQRLLFPHVKLSYVKVKDRSVCLWFVDFDRLQLFRTTFAPLIRGVEIGLI